MEISDLLMGAMNWKDEWKSASMEHGVLCVMIFGVSKMLVWLADSWDSLHQVGVMVVIVL